MVNRKIELWLIEGFIYECYSFFNWCQKKITAWNILSYYLYHRFTYVKSFQWMFMISKLRSLLSVSIKFANINKTNLNKTLISLTTCSRKQKLILIGYSKVYLYQHVTLFIEKSKTFCTRRQKYFMWYAIKCKLVWYVRYATSCQWDNFHKTWHGV